MAGANTQGQENTWSSVAGLDCVGGDKRAQGGSQLKGWDKARSQQACKSYAVASTCKLMFPFLGYLNSTQYSPTPVAVIPFG